ncbi:MAG: adenylyltransferase / riboflavin kinase, partial [Candidatus Aminicenantes bacterium]|nr:adenylyltransferase / riboflavin kinase [Candidatus Aminicenantes bacterium]
MVVYRGLADPRLLPRPAAVAVGNFDGLHLGHRRILSRLCALARKRGLRSFVLTFEPHPERALGKRSVLLIDTPAQRLERLRGTCVDAAAVIP